MTAPIIRARQGLLAAVLTALVASVWLYHGLFNKLLGGEVRHLAIVQSVPGLAGAAGEIVLNLVGVAEVMLALWVIWGRFPLTCAAVQTVALLAMNVVELTYARPHLLWPAGLLPVNLVFLAIVWTVAQMRRPQKTSNPLYWLRRHPIPIRAYFRHSLVLTYAFPRAVLEPLLPPGLALDAHDGHGFVAVAMVQTRDLRPTFLPRPFGQSFVLTGYRIFAKFTHDGRTRRGLRIIRSDTNRWKMVLGGNALTHYHYRKCDADVRECDGVLHVAVRTTGGAADVRVTADVRSPGALPDGSPFTSLHDARRFAGPLPFTFDYEPQTYSIIAIRGVRENWRPQLVNVNVEKLTFFDRPEFRGIRPILASAFYVHDIPYRWERGVRYALPKESDVNTTGSFSRFGGVAQIFRFNWTFYAVGVLAVVVATIAIAAGAVPMPRALKLGVIAGIALAAYWLIASLVASHVAYDRSPLRTWAWIGPALGSAPKRWINLHAGLDESTPALRKLFPGSSGRVLDIFDADEMTEPSILRARALTSNVERPEAADYRRLPVADGACDAAMLLLSAHELRREASRATLFRELHRVLAPGGAVVLAEHLRDAANFLAFGPGFLHFHSRAAWLGAAAAGGFVVEQTFRITPFVAVFILRRPS